MFCCIAKRHHYTVPSGMSMGTIATDLALDASFVVRNVSFQCIV